MHINKTLLEEQLFTYNKLYLTFLEKWEFKDLFLYKNWLLFFDRSNILWLIEKIQKEIFFVKKKYNNLKKTDKKLRTYGVISIFLFLLWNFYYKNILWKQKYGNYEFNKFKSIFLATKIELNKKYLLESEIIDMVFFYQFNKWFLNYIFLKKLNQNNLSIINDDINDSQNIITDYNLYVVDYYDFERKEINNLINQFTDYFETNKNEIFIEPINNILDKISKQEIELIKKQIKRKGKKKFNYYWIYFPDFVKKEIIKKILCEISTNRFRKYIEDKKLNLEIISNQHADNIIYVDIIENMINLFNSNFIK